MATYALVGRVIGGGAGLFCAGALLCAGLACVTCTTCACNCQSSCCVCTQSLIPPMIGILLCPFPNGESESNVVSATKKTTKKINICRRCELMRRTDRGNSSVTGSRLYVPGIRK